MKKSRDNLLGIIALVLPLGLCVVYPNNFISILVVGVILGVYVKLLNLLPTTLRRSIAFIHVLIILAISIYEMNLGNIPIEIASQLAKFKVKIGYYQIVQWLFLFGGLAFTMTRHQHIQPLCPYPKTRMGILIMMPALWIILDYFEIILAAQRFGYLSTRFAFILYGILMGFYVWMLERLNDKNRHIVLWTHSVCGIILSICLLLEIKIVSVRWMQFCLLFTIFSFILRIFKVKFISNSQKGASI